MTFSLATERLFTKTKEFFFLQVLLANINLCVSCVDYYLRTDNIDFLLFLIDNLMVLITEIFFRHLIFM